jgi:hypothetical protein
MRSITKNVAAELNATRIGATCQAILGGSTKLGVKPGGGGHAPVTDDLVSPNEVFMIDEALSQGQKRWCEGRPTSAHQERSTTRWLESSREI